MKKIGKLFIPQWYVFSLITLLFLPFATNGVQAQDTIEVSAQLSETNIYQGETVQLLITARGRSVSSISDPEINDIPGLAYLSGTLSTSQNITIVNGRPDIRLSKSLSFVADEIGSFSFPSLAIYVNGQEYQTEPISFRVMDSNEIGNNEGERLPDIYLRLETDNENPVVGEQIIANVMLYFKNGIEVTSYQASPGWKAEGFWKEELRNPESARATSTIVNGQRFQKAKLLQYALFPTKSGSLSLSPFEITVGIRKQRSTFSFGFGQERQTLQSPTLDIDVSDLPQAPDARFIGAVGDFNITRKLEPQSALVGESVEVTTRISGKGNVPLLNKPIYDYPDVLEQYNPEESSEINRTNQQISGFKTFTDVIIPRQPGTFEIPETTLAFYNTDRNRYELVTLPALNLLVKRDPESDLSGTEELRLDVSPITGLAQWSRLDNTPIYKKTWVWILFSLPILLSLAAYLYKIYADKMESDPAFARSQTALKNAQSILADAVQENDIKSSYHLIGKAIHNFISDKLDLPKAGLSGQQILSEIENQIPSDLYRNLKGLLNRCETIAYAPNATQEALDKDLELAHDIISKLQKVL